MSATKIEFAVQMTCQACVETVKSNLSGTKEIKNIDVDLRTGTVVVETTLSAETVRRKIESGGRNVVIRGIAGKQTGVCILDTGVEKVQGVVRFIQVNSDSCIIEGTIDGLKPGLHKIAVHECGDLSKGCELVGDFFDPKQQENRRIYGDIGVVTAEENGRLMFRLEDSTIKLNDIIGRSFVVSEMKNNSLTKIACGIIARSSGLFGNPKTICACDGVSLWDEQIKPDVK